jgi:DNA-binding phage protein
MHALTDNSEHIKSWREIKIFLEQVIQIIDSQNFIQEIKNKKY